MNYYKTDYENTVKRKIERNEFSYMDAMSYETIGNSWVESEDREHDLDLDDAELDHAQQQNKMLQFCLKFIAGELDEDYIEEFLKHPKNYADCLDLAPDIIHHDDFLLFEEKVAMDENKKKYEAYHHGQI